VADLAAGIGTRSRLSAVADQYFVDVGRAQTGAFDRGARRSGAELGGMDVAERAAVPADGRTGGAKDDDV